MRFLENATLGTKYFNPVGNNGWYSRDGKLPSYDQQAIDSMAMVLMYAQAHRLTNDQQYLEKQFFVYSWFLGENSLSVPVYDRESKGCCDGLNPVGINLNQGAESSLAYLISHLAILESFKSDQVNIYRHNGRKDSVLK